MKVSSLFLLFFPLFFLSGIQAAHCQVKNYHCFRKISSTSGSQKVDDANYPVSIDVDRKTIYIKEATPLRFRILGVKTDSSVVTKNRVLQVTVYKVKEENGRHGDLVFIASIPDETHDGSTTLYYDPPTITIGRKAEEKHPRRAWCLESI